MGAALATLFLLGLLLNLTGNLTGLSPLAGVLLGILPLHVAALVVCIAGAVMAPGATLANLDLRPSPAAPPGRGLGHALTEAGKLVALFYPVSLALTWLTTLALRGLGVEVEASPFLDVFCGVRNNWQVAIAAVAALGLAPVAEEILFRLVLFESLSALKVPAAAAWGAALFAAIHYLPAAAPALFCLALLLQWARRRYGTLLVPVLVHVLFNAISVALLLAGVA